MKKPVLTAALLSALGRPLVFATLWAMISTLTSAVAPSGAQAASTSGATREEEEEYDRLDGMGASGKKVQVIEWEGNLEVHVYPGGSLKGLALKLDKRNKSKPVMVIGYRFNDNPTKQLIRRAILGIDLHPGFKMYRDPSSGSEYDKVIISNNGLSGQLTSFGAEPEPTQLYPDGHPALADGKDGGKDGYKPRGLASQSGNPEAVKSKRVAPAPESADVDDNGTIQPFFTKKSQNPE
jgi:hypothetical protein